MVKCPQCGLDVPEVIPIGLDLRARVKALDPDYPLMEEVCRSCFSSLRKKMSSSGGMLMAEERAKEERKGKLWKSRTSLVKKGHTQMASHLYSEAAISYEKYLKLIEMCFGKPPGGVTPETLKEASKTQELTVIAGVYWDLVRIYDTSDQYGERQTQAANKLALFLPYTPIFPDIIRKATAFQKQARHPDIIRSFLIAARKKRTHCFIATSAFLAPAAPEVTFLRKFRDQNLKTNLWGRRFVKLYYAISPKIAGFLDKHSFLKPFVRAILRFVINCVS